MKGQGKNEVVQQVTAPSGKGDSEAVASSRNRRAMARRMSRTVDIPTFFLQRSLDITRIVRARRNAKSSSEAWTPSLNDYIVQACALALRDHPLLNASYEDSRVITHTRINVGVAMAIQDDLIVPAIYDADEKDVEEIGMNVRELLDLAPNFSRAILSDTTFTITNLGMFGVESFQPVINPPQSAILAVGTSSTVQMDTPAECTSVNATLGCDHRVLTGVDGARFLADLNRLLQSAGSDVGAA